ncbi:MAG: tRNA ((37)-N6)-threonylcarbamoyltransferase complex transferase subunit TsaD [Bacteroidota bacterium]|jgi:N6-L-threonylcarbamoyladenine synthase|nr:tRNA (adenosine(37)-N6)-threonylcarbamoyltransferase complex transferase subunit TsaD [Chitinophagia bacterium]
MKANDGIYLLGIESSCDETAAAICHDGKIISNIIATQAIHQQYGGVVPELASRAHMQNIVPVISQAIHQAGIELNQLSGVAFTQSPGLIGALLVGTGFAKSLALSLNLPLIPVHHMQAHVLSNLIEKEDMPFPFLCLTVSGGHTQIVVCRSPLDMHVIGETLDDAAGEAFDKSAKLLGLPYPGGPLIDQFAQEGDPLRFHFPEPQMEGLDFSFSGVKTSILYFLQKMTKENPSFVQDNLADLCASIQHCIVGILMKKVKKASLETGIRTICMAGGVSANKGLRKALVENGQKYHWDVHIPSFAYCTDNAAMIALTGYHKFLAGERAPLSITASARATW